MIDVSIIIVSYNVKDLLVKCIDSVNTFCKIKFEIIVIDNNSSDGSSEAVKSKYPEIVIIKNDFNAGFPAANNQGFRIANGKYIFMLNPDTEIIDDSISKLISCIDGEPKIAAIGPKLLNPDNSLQFSAWRFPSITYIFAEMCYFDKFSKSKYYFDMDFNKPFVVDSLSGAALMFRKESLSNIGFLDENLFWIEDVDFCYRIKKAGFKTLYFPQAHIIHYIGQSAKKNYNVSISNQIFNKIKFFKTHYSAFEMYIVIMLSFINCVVKFISLLLLSLFNVTFYKKSLAYWYTIRKLISRQY